MRVPRSLLERLSDEVGALSGAARELVGPAAERLVSEFSDGDGDVAPEDVAALRDAAAELMAKACSAMADRSAARAAEYYDAVRGLEPPETPFSAAPLTGQDPGALAGAVRALAQRVVDGRPEEFASGLAARADYEVRRAANECVALNCARDPARPRYARVPVGAETCPFCLQLSAYGFHYKSAEAAGHAHAGCDCRVVPDFGGAEVDGYDPDGMYERLQEVVADLGGRDGVRAEWDALPADERARAIARNGGKEGKAFDAFLRNRVSEGIGLRDPVWFKTGVLPARYVGQMRREAGDSSGPLFELVRSLKDEEWLRSGRRPRIAYSDEPTEKKKRDDPNHPAGIRVAKRLARLGFQVVFVDDEPTELDPETGQRRPYGLADLANGLEIKNVSTASSENSISKHLGKSKKTKRNLKVVLIDISENRNIADEEGKRMISNSLRRHHMPYALMMNHSQEVETVLASNQTQRSSSR